VIAAFEIGRMYARNAVAISPLATASLAALPVVRWMVAPDVRVWIDVAFGGLAAALLLAAMWRPESGTRFSGWVLALGAALYTGGLLGLAVPLRDRPDGFGWVLLALGVTWAYDSAAYMGGRRFGRHGFATRISPRKTWEGVGAGLLATIAVTAAFTPFLPLAWWQVVPLGLAWAAAAQAGDLVESMLKRDTGQKNSGALIPGHGGMLDRIDSLLFVVPAVYAFVRLAA
jgi:phosphatidate cytidylyltransferase